MAVESDDVALGVTTNADGSARDLLENPVRAFCGWVKADEDTIYLYTDNWFMAWLEIPADKVVYQVKGSERPHDEFKSTIWVEADARLTRHTLESPEEREAREAFVAAGTGQTATAAYFARPDQVVAYDKPPPSR